MRARNAIARFTRARFVSRTSATRSSSVTTTSALGRPIFGMPLLDHRLGVSPSDFVSRGLEHDALDSFAQNGPIEIEDKTYAKIGDA